MHLRSELSPHKDELICPGVGFLFLLGGIKDEVSKVSV
jgi:hypothetical protein